MRSTLAVFRRELALYFRSPVAYAIAFALLLFLGVLFNGFIAQANASLSFGNGIPADAGFAPNLLTFLMFLIAPLLTMRLLAEESREGTLEVLMTLPMHESSFIIGKFLAAWAYYTALLLLSLVFYILQTFVGAPDAGVALGAYGGAWLYGGAVLAITMIWSAVTEDQIVAAFLGSATILVLYLAEIRRHLDRRSGQLQHRSRLRARTGPAGPLFRHPGAGRGTAPRISPTSSS